MKNFDKDAFLNQPLLWLTDADHSNAVPLSLMEWLSSLQTYMSRLNAGFENQDVLTEAPGYPVELHGLKRQNLIGFSSEYWLNQGMLFESAQADSAPLLSDALAQGLLAHPPLAARDFSSCLSPTFGQGLPTAFVRALERALVQTPSFCTSLPLKTLETTRNDELFEAIVQKMHPDFSEEKVLETRFDYLKNERVKSLEDVKAIFSSDPLVDPAKIEQVYSQP
jgi:hypothetical protein